jgi:hypothetical protein
MVPPESDQLSLVRSGKVVIEIKDLAGGRHIQPAQDVKQVDLPLTEGLRRTTLILICYSLLGSLFQSIEAFWLLPIGYPLN